MNRKTRIILAAVVLLALFGNRTFTERRRPSAATSCTSISTG